MGVDEREPVRTRQRLHVDEDRVDSGCGALAQPTTPTSNNGLSPLSSLPSRRMQWKLAHVPQHVLYIHRRPACWPVSSGNSLWL